MKQLILAGFVLGMIFSGCSNSRITSSWNAPDIAPAKYKKIIVLGLIGDQDRRIREQMEMHLVGDLKSLGYHAVSSFTEFGPKAFDNLCEQDAVDKIKNSGADAVITVVLLDKSKEQYYVPARRSGYTRSVYYNRFGGYFTTIYDRVYTPGYYVSDTKYFWESNLYEMAAKNLVYSVQTESFDPATSESLGHEYGKLIVADMVSKNILAKQ